MERGLNGRNKGREKRMVEELQGLRKKTVKEFLKFLPLFIFKKL